MQGITFTIDIWQIVQVVVAVILPVLVGLVTKTTTDAGLKAVLLAALAVVTSIGTEALAAHNAGTGYDVGQALTLGLGSFVIAVATHYGLWKPTGVSTAVGSVGTSQVDPANAPEESAADVDDEDDTPTVDLDEDDVPVDDEESPYADDQAALDAKLEADATPVPDDYEPKH